MIFKSAFRKEFAGAAAATFVALFSIVIASGLVRTLGQAASGRIDNTQVFIAVLLGTIKFLPSVVVITVFVAIMGTVSRNYRESEMTAWMASGLSMRSLVAPAMRFAIPLTFLSLICATLLAPWSNHQMQVLKDRFSQRSDVSKMSAGQFRESGDGGRVFFIERQNDVTREVDNVFVVDRNHGDRLVLVAKSGRIETDDEGRRFLVLNEGLRYGLTEDGHETNYAQFAQYGLYIQTNLQASSDLPTKFLPTHELILMGGDDAMGELLWRFSIPLSALVLAYLALPLGFVNPRGGRSLNYIFALLIYFTYSNVISIFQSAVSKGQMPFLPALLLPHAVVLSIAFYLAYLRSQPQGMGVFRSLRRLGKAAR